MPAQKLGPKFLLIVSVLWCCSSYSHHSTLGYDTEQNITVTGLVTRLEWQNPHVYIYLDQLTESHTTVKWVIEGSPPAVMRRLGWSKNTLAPGEAISITGNPHRDGNVKRMLPATIVQADKELFNMAAFFDSSNDYEEPEKSTDNIAGKWFTVFDMPQMIKFVVPTTMALTEAGKRSVSDFDEETMLPALNCIASPAPSSMIFPDIKKIEVADDHIVIRGEYEDTRRTIYFGPTATPPSSSIQGRSIGHWQDGTLVIDTDNFSEHRVGNGAGLASSRERTLREWITLDQDGKSLHYRYELNDPLYFAEPVTGEARWIFQPNAVFAPEDCDLENARKFAE